MRLVHDDDRLVLVQHRQVKGDVWFAEHPTVMAQGIHLGMPRAMVAALGWLARHYSTVTDLARLRGLSTS